MDGHGWAWMGTETRNMTSPTPMARDLNYLNQIWEYLSTKKTINILALARRDLNYLNHKRGYLSTMKTIIFNNKNYKHPMARAPRNLNYLNQKCEYLSTKENNKHPCAGRRDLNYLNQKQHEL